MALRNIMHYQDDAVLKKRSRIVVKINERTLILLEDMVETMYTANGVSLAAAQVGILKRIVVIGQSRGSRSFGYSPLSRARSFGRNFIYQ